VRVPAIVCCLAIGCGVLAAGTVLVQRMSLESGNRSVELVVDYNEAAVLAGATGRTVADVLSALRLAGATGAGVPEDSLVSLVDTGRARVAAERTPRQADEGECVELDIPSPALREQVEENLAAKWSLGEDGAGAGDLLCVPGALADLEHVGVGWDPRRIADVDRSGLQPIARPLDSPVISTPGIQRTFEQLADAGFGGVLFQGKFVLGNSALIEETAREIRDRGLQYYSIELEVQAGTEELSRQLKGCVVRTHSIGENELGKMTPDVAVARFVRGVRERNIRCCFVRLFLDRACADPLALNADYIGALKRDVEASGCVVGPARPFPPFNLGHRLAPAVALGAAGGLGLVLLMVLGPGRLWWGCFAAGVAACCALPVVHSLGLHAVALAAVTCLPLTGVLAMRLDRPGGNTALRMLGGLGLAAACSLLGGWLAAGLLTDSMLMAKVGQFRGVKLALYLPVLLAGCIYGMQLFHDDRPLGRRLVEGAHRGLQFLRLQLSLGTFLAVIVVLGAAAYGLARSGNAASSTVSGFERLIRDSLEMLLVYRPRTKEFLIGHPALVLAGYFAARGKTTPALVCGVAGTVGLTSLANTFCHIHTPLAATLLRTLFGVLLGAVVGLLAAGVTGWLLGVRERIRVPHA
jgi:hypothetical protein